MKIRVKKYPELDCTYYNPYKDEIILVERAEMEECIEEILVHETIHLLLAKLLPNPDDSTKLDIITYWKGNILMFRYGRKGKWKG